MSHTQLYLQALRVCAQRYTEMAEGHEDLLPFIKEFSDSIEISLPLMKLNRWLGYIQGVLIERGETTVEAERDFTRPYFRPLDYL